MPTGIPSDHAIVANLGDWLLFGLDPNGCLKQRWESELAYFVIDASPGSVSWLVVNRCRVNAKLKTPHLRHCHLTDQLQSALVPEIS